MFLKKSQHNFLQKLIISEDLQVNKKNFRIKAQKWCNSTKNNNYQDTSTIVEESQIIFILKSLFWFIMAGRYFKLIKSHNDNYYEIYYNFHSPLKLIKQIKQQVKLQKKFYNILVLPNYYLLTMYKNFILYQIDLKEAFTAQNFKGDFSIFVEQNYTSNSIFIEQNYQKLNPHHIVNLKITLTKLNINIYNIAYILSIWLVILIYIFYIYTL